MSIETLLARTVAHAPDFDPAIALGRIHSILSALIQHCKTRAAYIYTGCFTCELQICPLGGAFVPAVVPDFEAKMELVRIWELVREMDVPSGVLVPRTSHPVVSEPHRLQLTRTAESLVFPDTIKPTESFTHLLSRTIIAPFAMYFALKLSYDIFWKVLPIATLIFQFFFFLLFALFSLIFSAIFCVTVLASR